MAVPAAAAPVAAPIPAQGKALILIPLTLTKIDDLDFGTVVTSPVVRDRHASTPTTGARAFAGGATGMVSDAGHRALFAGAGTPSQQVIVFITPPAPLTNGAGDTIPVLALTLDNGGNPIRTIDATRAFFVGVGGIVQINANQPEGIYQATLHRHRQLSLIARRALNGAGAVATSAVMPADPAARSHSRSNPASVACDGSGEVAPGARPSARLSADRRRTLGFVECGYCDRRFVLEGGPADSQAA